MKKSVAFGILCFVFSQCTSAQLWTSVQGGCSREVRAFLPDSTGNLMYVVGSFQKAGGVVARGTATWDGTIWGAIGGGTGDTLNTTWSPPIMSVVQFDGDLFVGGMFGFMEGDRSIRFLSRWDGTRWNACGNPNTTAHLRLTNGHFFAMGGFDSIGGRGIRYIARREGQEWVSFGDPLQMSFGSQLSCSEYYLGEYYFGGNFSSPGGASDIIRWDGAQWNAVGTGIAGDVWVNDLIAYKGQLFVAGDFHAGDGNPASYVMAWDGNQWYDPFPEVQFTTQSQDLEVIDGNLYIVGSHAVWNGTEWKGLYNLAKYDGQEFCSFGGENLWTFKVAGFNGDIYVATGEVINPFGPDSLFPNGRDTVNFIAKWLGGDSVDICVSQPVGRGKAAELDEARISVYPNPASDGFSIAFGDGVAQSGKVSILDISGRLILPEQTWRTGDAAIDVSQLPAGVYLVQVRVRDRAEYVKLIKE